MLKAKVNIELLNSYNAMIQLRKAVIPGGNNHGILTYMAHILSHSAGQSLQIYRDMESMWDGY